MAREFPHKVRFAGLRPERQSVDGGVVFCETLKDMKPTEGDLVGFDAVTNPLDISPAVAWPFPQLLRGEGVTVVANATGLYTVDESDWTTTAVTTYDIGTPANTKAITTGGVWQFASFQANWFMTNGVDMVLKIPSNSGDKVMVADDITVQAIGGDGNRVFFGGMAGSYFTDSSVWTTMLELWKVYSGDDIVTYDDQVLTTNWIAWSGMAGGEFDWPFVSFIAALGYPESTTVAKIEEVLYSNIENGNIGLLPLRSQGSVQVLKQLGDDMVAYCTDSISYLHKTERGYSQQKLLPVGIASRGAVCGDENEHVFVDHSGVVWRFSAGSKPVKLGYSSSVGALTLASISTTFDSTERDYYISDGTTGYVLSRGGLSEISSIPTTVSRSEDGLVGPIATTPTAFTLTTEQLKMSVPDLKSIKVVELMCDGITVMTVGADFRYANSGAYITLTAVPGSPEGVFFPRVAGTDFKLKINGTVTANSRLENAIVRFQYASGRSVRGPRGEGFSGIQAAEDAT